MLSIMLSFSGLSGLNRVSQLQLTSRAQPAVQPHITFHGTACVVVTEECVLRFAETAPVLLPATCQWTRVVTLKALILWWHVNEHYRDTGTVECWA
jgi:hypothetical protein